MIDSEKLVLPLIAAPMFLVSGPEIVTACCRAGIVGTFPALNQRTTEGFESWLDEIEAALDGTSHPGFGVNLIAHKSNPRLQADLEVCVRHKVPLVITSLGAVPELVEAVHSYGGLVFHDVINLRHARKAAGAGVDGLIAVSAGAGGHAGTINPFALIAEIRQFFDKIVLLAGSLNSGGDIAAAQMAGADYAYMGTRFINTVESRACEGHKSMISESTAADVVYTDKVSGVSGNFLGASLQTAQAAMEAESQSGTTAEPGDDGGRKEIDFGKELLAPEDEAKAWKDIWSAGQGVGGISDVPSVAELVHQMQQQYKDALNRMALLGSDLGK
ncbi:MAG: nitronate monooxygenase family protein [Granulosicoccus sp.]